MQPKEKRDQSGVWKKAAPCLYQYQTNKVYYAVVRRAGKLIRKSLEVTQLEVAKRKLRDYLNELESIAPDATKVRFDEYMKEFLGGKTGAFKTLERYRHMVALVESSWPGGAHQLLRAVDLNQCTQWLSRWNGKVAQYNLARQWLLSFFDFAVANRKIQRSPIDKRLLRPLRRPKVIRNAPTPEEFDAIIDEVRSQRFTDHANDTADVLEFMGRAGVGQAETKGLRWERVDFQSGSIQLFRVKTQTAYKIPIYPKLRPLLEGLKEKSSPVNPSAPVFKICDPKKALASACVRLKLPNFSPRSLRRMFIIEALNRGVPVKTISKWQGHQDGGVLILKTYSETIDQKAHQEAAHLLA